jgi:stage II sporulation protein M
MSFRSFTVEYGKFLAETIKRYKIEIGVLVTLFAGGLVAGACTDQESLFIREMVESLFQEFSGVRGISFTLQLFFHNILASVISLAGIVFSIFPLCSALINGAIIGHIATLLEDLSGLSTVQFVLLILPHGVFEIPAFLISMSLGTRLGTWPFRKNKIEFLEDTFKDYLIIFYKFIFPMLLMAAIIESITAEILYRWSSG